MPHGGARSGAGAKPHVVKFGKEIHETRKEMVNRRAAYLANLMNLAEGIWVEKEVRNNKGEVVGTRVYQKEPNANVNMYLLDQVIGRVGNFADDQLALARAKLTEVEADLAKARIEQARAQTELILKNAGVFELSLASPDMFKPIIVELCRAAVQFLQSNLVAAPPKDFEETQSFILRFTHHMMATQQTALESASSVFDIKPEDEEE